MKQLITVAELLLYLLFYSFCYAKILNKERYTPELWSPTKFLSLQQELSMAYVCPQMLSLLPRRGRLQRTVYTSKITFQSSLVPEDVVDPSYARAHNQELYAIRLSSQMNVNLQELLPQ